MRDEIWREPVALGRRLRLEEARRALIPEFHAHTLDGDERDAKSPRDLGLGSRAIIDQLAGKEAERSDVITGVGKDRHVTVKIDDPIIDPLEAKMRGDEGAGVRKDGKLKLGHGPTFSKRQRR